MISLESNLRALKSRLFTAHGRRPYARGYGAYRQTQLQEYVSREFPEGSLPAGWGLWLDERAIEYPWLFSRLPASPGRILDAGSALNFDYLLDHPRLKNKSISIFTLGPEATCYWDRGISYLYGDLRDLCFRDGYFDWIVCISTLEHVGMDNTAFYTKDPSKNESDSDAHLRAVVELRRALKPGGTLFVTLPFGRRQNLGWLQVFDDRSVANLVSAFAPSATNQQFFRYSDTGWQKSTSQESKDAAYFDRWAQSPDQMPCAAAEAIVCLELVK